MNSEYALGIINIIGNTSSTREKQQIIIENIYDDLFRKCLEYALNPEKIYGIVTDTSWITETGMNQFDDSVFALLDQLIRRELTGHAARDAIIDKLKTLEPSSAELLVRIIRKDLRGGFGDKLVNKAWKNLIPTYSYMRCSLLEGSKIKEFNWERGIYSELKLDGMFVNGNIMDGSFQFTSRAGSVFPMEGFKTLSDSVAHLKGYQLHGELLVKENGIIMDRKKGNGVLNSVLSGGSFADNQEPLYIVWDVIPLEEVRAKNKYHVPYSDRLTLLHSLVDSNPLIQVVEYKICYSLQECMLHAKEVMLQGQEGTVIKSPDMIWEDGTSKYQIKIKVEFECELEIVEILPGKINSKIEGRAGSLKCISSDGLLEVNVTVKNEKMRDTIDADPKDWIGRIVTVRSNDVMVSDNVKNKHSLFLPRLVEDTYRIDKSDSDSYDKILQLMKESIG